MRLYRQYFTYDKLGNILEVKHRSGSTNSNFQDAWTRRYRYDDPSALQTGDVTNRLTRTTLDDWATSVSYTYDVHGNMKFMSHLPDMKWDYADQLAAIQIGVGVGATWEYYDYDAGGTRSRKVWHKSGGVICDRMYLGGIFEVYRERGMQPAIFPWSGRRCM